MKKSILIPSVLLLMVSLVAFGSNRSNESESESEPLPAKVKTIVDNSCFGCHNTDSRNEDAKKALDFMKLDSLSTVKMIHAYKEIGEVLEENEMPPKRFLERFPDRALNDADKKLLLDWSKEQTEALVKGM
ncbi:MAG TPA: heme-binding domain-containing protein [Draconibacterium sp.]|nr:heme-binding domain-containing protein [Draconibacterium sp.]